jgi:outer membrane protein assembly factor BamA
MSRKVVVRRIEVKGNQRTNGSFFENELREVVACDNFQDLHSSLVNTTKRMETFGIFSSVDAVIKVRPSEVTKAGFIPISLFIEVKEKNVVFSKVRFNGEGRSDLTVLTNPTAVRKLLRQ